MSATPRKPASHSIDGSVVCLGSPARENDFPAFRGEKISNLRTGPLNSCTSVLAIGVDGGSVPELVQKERLDRLQHPRVHGTGCIVVQINSSLHFSRSWFLFSRFSFYPKYYHRWPESGSRFLMAARAASCLLPP